jgi:hypothetical protein
VSAHRSTLFDNADFRLKRFASALALRDSFVVRLNQPREVQSTTEVCRPGADKHHIHFQPFAFH